VKSNRVAVEDPLLLKLGLVETNTKGRVPQVVVFLLLISPDHPLVVAWALGIDLNGHQLETGRQLHLGLEDLLTCPVGWLLKSLKPESFGDLITTITKASLL